jgi:uncharacterized protein
MGSFDSLLDLQQLDTALTQLQYRRSHLPEQEQLNDVQRKLSALAAATAPGAAARDELDRRQGALEQQIHEVDAKIDMATKQLYGGTVTASRELQALEADIASLKRHRSELEDAELEVLMEREPVDAELAGADAKRAELDDTASKAHVAIAEAIVAIDRETADLIDRRTGMAAGIDATIRETYERLRTKNGGVGVAKLEHGTCMSCRLKISAVQLDQLKKIPETDIAFCEECGAILVR